MKKRIALIGLGPHAKRIYYPYIEELTKSDSNFSLELIIDLELNRSQIESFLQDQKLQPKKIIYLDAKDQLNPTLIHPSAAQALKKYKINKAIIATEPKAHKIYITECIKLGIQLVTDKPITTPLNLISSIESSQKIYQDAIELANDTKTHPDSRVLIQCQRRNHQGYNYIFELIKNLIKKYNIPITFISIHHSDGMWNMPNELFQRENHPYKYGYGKLMHSGYHFIDLLLNLLQINNLIDDKQPDDIEVFSQYSRAIDQQTVINTHDYKDFFGKNTSNEFNKFAQKEELSTFGEIDSYSQIQLTRKNRILTTAQLSLMQSGFSQRAWPTLPEDTYKSNGRVRHEHINIHLGPLASIQIHSYQSKQINDQPISLYDTGQNNHFDIYIFRNSNLIGGKSFEKIQYGSWDLNSNNSNKYLGHNENARYQTLDELMFNLPSKSEIQSHLATNKLLSEIYKNHAKQTLGKIPISKFQIKELFNEPTSI